MACLRLPFISPSLAQSNFIIVPMVTDRLINRMGLEPILSVNVDWTVTKMVRINGILRNSMSNMYWLTAKLKRNFRFRVRFPSVWIHPSLKCANTGDLEQRITHVIFNGWTHVSLRAKSVTGNLFYRAVYKIFYKTVDCNFFLLFITSHNLLWEVTAFFYSQNFGILSQQYPQYIYSPFVAKCVTKYSDCTCWAVIHGDHYITATIPGTGIDRGCM